MMTVMASPYLFRKGMKIKFSKYRLHLKVQNFVIPHFTSFFQCVLSKFLLNVGGAFCTRTW